MPQTIVVMSRDRDFSSVVAEHARQELGLACRIASNSEEAGPHLAAAALAVAAEGELKESPCPVVAAKPPVRLHDLLGEIAATLQKQAAESVALPRGVTLQPRQKRLMGENGQSADLTDKEMQLLQSLAEAGSKGAAKEQLLKSVWGIDAALDTHTLETHIYRLRGKLRELAGQEMIAATSGGYKLEK